MGSLEKNNVSDQSNQEWALKNKTEARKERRGHKHGNGNFSLRKEELV